MSRLMRPNDSPIWLSLNESYAHLDLETREMVFQFLQESGIPPTDKIYPWVVETMVNRVAMIRLESQLDLTQGKLKALPDHLVQSMGQALSGPVLAIESSQVSIENLTVELRRNSVIESSLTQSGWRGVLCSLEAIAQNRILGLTVGAIALLSAIFSGGVVWGLGSGDRQIIQFNKQTFENCYQKFAVDGDRNGWFSCPGIQLPMH